MFSEISHIFLEEVEIHKNVSLTSDKKCKPPTFSDL